MGSKEVNLGEFFRNRRKAGHDSWGVIQERPDSEDAVAELLREIERIRSQFEDARALPTLLTWSALLNQLYALMEHDEFVTSASDSLIEFAKVRESLSGCRLDKRLARVLRDIGHSRRPEADEA